ncbi:MAG: peptidase domain-containing ABC transporter [Pseudomonadales bacterium]|jgi:ATP-binding cassette subfamily B protein RaxB|nr:peptidase domain-containing ABC transporter [Pseudomonadales bacterium]MDP7358259.1 peptidase domain-containing ABC transporter [Pseudomonadales bacterium]MDP7597740.1 peptidase domain-containing ABC transporter [Pseudomonadales bacterium]HJN52374.1 peptidase domain-containing ABC transporter [Pseudomonadales bacterium]|tara:strand:- start:491 stop:2608 length:2118 start_codon:yes stop_codon:yes gene_type:complete
MRRLSEFLNFSGTASMPVILQGEASECGLACLAMVASHHGFRTDLHALRQRFGVSLAGASLRNLMRSGADLGLSCRALRVDPNELRKMRLPAILHWDFNHYVTLRSASRSHVVVHNPAVGVRRYRLAEIGQHFTGIALEITPTTQFQRGNTTQRLHLLDFCSGMKGMLPAFTQLLVLSLLIQCFALASPFYLQLVVDEVLIKQDRDLLVLLGVGFAGLTVITVMTKALRGSAHLFIASQLNYAMGTALFSHLIRLPVGYFQKRHMGDVVSRFGSMKPIQDFISSSALTVILDGLMAITTLVMIIIYSPLLSTIVLVSIASFAVLRAVLLQPFRHRTQESIVTAARQDSNLMESVRALQSIKVFSREGDRQSLWQSRFADAINANISIGRLTIGHEILNGLISGVENVLVVFVGAQEVLDGAMTVGMLYAFISYRLHFNSSLTSVINQLIQFLMLDLHLERIADIGLTDKEKGLEEPAGFTIPLEGYIQLDRASFSYSESDPLLFKELSLQFEPGEFTAIYGPSGIGKTTVIKILLGLLTPTQGGLMIDKIPLDVYGIRSYRANIGAVLQEDVLMSGSIRDNICFSDMFADFDRIERVAQLTEIHDDIIRMPMGYDTPIGEMGCALSNGQQQRILLARALYQKPKLLYLDEGTAHLDDQSAERIMANLHSLGISCVYITHNRRLLKFADHILGMARGQQKIVHNRK